MKNSLVLVCLLGLLASTGPVFADWSKRPGETNKALIRRMQTERTIKFYLNAEEAAQAQSPNGFWAGKDRGSLDVWMQPFAGDAPKYGGVAKYIDSPVWFHNWIVPTGEFFILDRDLFWVPEAKSEKRVHIGSLIGAIQSHPYFKLDDEFQLSRITVKNELMCANQGFYRPYISRWLVSVAFTDSRNGFVLDLAAQKKSELAFDTKEECERESR